VAEATADGVRLVGFSDRPERYYAAADLFVLASHREGFPRAAMEASAMGLPVIATDIRGCRQVVDDGVTGSAGTGEGCSRVGERASVAAGRSRSATRDGSCRRSAGTRPV
jgi:glycosyltransferase involved in cell wall biosynthesis